MIGLGPDALEQRTPSGRPAVLAGLALAAAASIGAGAIHAAAAGVHAEHPQLARAFVVCAALQIAVGGWGVLRASRVAAVAIAVVNAAAVGGWLLTRITSITWIDGLEIREAPAFADTACAVLGSVAGGLAVASTLMGWQHARPRRSALASLAVVALAAPAMWVGGTTTHAHSTAAAGTDGVIDESQPHSHDEAGASVTTTPTVSSEVPTTNTVLDESQPHSHDTPTSAGDPSADDPTQAVTEPVAAVAPTPYDPAKPIDLGGVSGVTPAEQAAAENLVAINVVRLPRWSDYRVAEAAGFHSIGDGGTGHEHFINWDWINDDVWLDPDHPESLVYVPRSDGSKQLVSAMYMLPSSVALADVPDIGGSLMQWHIHDNLCFTDDPVAPRVAGLRSPGGTCPSGLKPLEPAPMIHVWITSHPCGPFAALEGVAAGSILDGESRLCDHAHGDGLL